MSGLFLYFNYVFHLPQKKKKHAFTFGVGFHPFKNMVGSLFIHHHFYLFTILNIIYSPLVTLV